MSLEAPAGASPQEDIQRSVHTAEFDGRLYNVDILMSLAEGLPEEVVPVESLSAMLDGNYWKDRGDNWLGPHHVLDAAPEHADGVDWDSLVKDHPDWEDQLGKIRDADYAQHPLLVVGADFVIDGMHRLTRAAVEGAKEIKVKRFKELPEEALYDDGSETS